MAVRIWDRLLDRETRAPSGRGTLGRLIFVPGTRALSLNGVPARPGRFLATDNAWTLWDGTERRSTQGEFGHAPVPAGITAHAVVSIGRRLAALIEEGAPADRWLDETPLMGGADMDDRLATRRIDEQIALRLPHLRAACHRPVTRLRTVYEVVPASRARRITPRAVVRLAAHSEDWAGLRPDSVRPARLLDPGRETHLDFYENRVLARLVDHLWEYVHTRLVEVGQIEAMLDDIGLYARDASERPWRVSHYMFHLIEGLVRNDERRERVRQVQEDLGRLHNILVELRGPMILPGVHRRVDVGVTLRATNVFANDDRYRNVAELWRAWVAARGGTERDGESADRSEAWCHAFTQYTALLLLQAFAQLDLLSDGPFHPDGPPLPLGEGIDLTWTSTGTFVVARDGRAVLRVVPIPHSLTASRRSEQVAEEIDALTAAKGMSPRTLVVYPGQRAERTDLPLPLRLRAFQGCDAPAPVAGGPLLPVSPLEIDSVTRLARSLRHALVQGLVDDYPAVIACPAEYARTIAEGVDWLAAAPDGLRMLRPPAPHELATARRRIDKLGVTTAQFMQRGGNSDLIERLGTDLSAAAERMAAFLRCPLCRAVSADPARTLRLRDDETFTSTCDVCDTVWELRRCGSCDNRYPVLRADDSDASHVFDGDEIDRRFGSETLSARCWTRPAVSYCPHCGVCGEAAKLTTTCQRCPAAPPTG
ncbi:hypothetical protein [Actinomadura miaoliensis]|uniref:DUF2357 domain-containing protein n=1 Tax=Actinomadura miaoliensis TaxID=430685 RepID=A0ABP7WRT1_9ACTN